MWKEANLTLKFDYPFCNTRMQTAIRNFESVAKIFEAFKKEKGVLLKSPTFHNEDINNDTSSIIIEAVLDYNILCIADIDDTLKKLQENVAEETGSSFYDYTVTSKEG